jgi:hypothetical protein
MLADSDAGRAVAALFAVTDLGGSRVQLAIPSLACGGWTAPTGQRAAITWLRDGLVAKILEAVHRGMQAVLDRNLAAQRLSLGASEEHGRKRVGELSRALVAMTAERDALRAGALAAPKQLAMFAEPVAGRLSLATIADRAGRSEPAPAPTCDGDKCALPPGHEEDHLPRLPKALGVKPRKCGGCGMTGHNARTCPVLAGKGANE